MWIGFVEFCQRSAFQALAESLARYDIGRMPGNPHGRDTVSKLHCRHASEVTVSLANGRRSDCLPLSFSLTSSSSPSVFLSHFLFLSTFPVLKHWVQMSQIAEEANNSLWNLGCLKCDRRESDLPVFTATYVLFTLLGDLRQYPAMSLLYRHLPWWNFLQKRIHQRFFSKGLISIKICLNERNLVFKHWDRLRLCISNDHAQCIKKKN